MACGTRRNPTLLDSKHPHPGHRAGTRTHGKGTLVKYWLDFGGLYPSGLRAEKTFTRITNSSRTTIDLCLTNSNNVQMTGTLEYNISDHLPIFCLRKKSRNLKETVSFSGRSYRNYDPAELRDSLRNLNWNYFYSLSDPSQCWKFIYNAIL